ncbi:Dps family protein [Paeniglutamicibacter antarcticus]|uniref:DNA starvation/stationary phase protection protein n=1 Tax=Paeniglutamicibacter antarcticus TaxID=494023 RepID=A0ABP9TLX8_9MICC
MSIDIPTPSGDAGTKLENSEAGFVAPARLHESLQAVLVDLVNLHLLGKQAHWNIVGTNFRDLHLNLDELVTVARVGADDVAERMRALHATPDARVAVVAAGTSLPEFAAGEINTTDAIKLVVRAIEATVGTMREVHDGVDEDDPTSADLLHEVIAKLEQQAWFIGAEIREPSPLT